MSGLGEAWAAGLKSCIICQQSAKLSSSSIKTSQPARTLTSSKDRQIVAYYIGLSVQSGAQKVTGENLKLVWSKFSTLS